MTLRRAPHHPPMLGGFVARVRRFYWLHVRRHHSELCQFCVRPYRMLWWSPADLWPDDLHLSCPECFDKLLDRADMPLVIWTPRAGREGDDFIEQETRKAIETWRNR
jgi:hypothetical protein